MPVSTCLSETNELPDTSFKPPSLHNKDLGSATLHKIDLAYKICICDVIRSVQCLVRFLHGDNI